jgi:predicted transcriptional regulator
VKIYRLSNPFSEIVDVIEREKREQAATQLSLIQEIRTYIQ